MGKRGPKPEPTALKVFKGNPGKRALPTNEPDPPKGDVVPPFPLDDIAQIVWDSMLAKSHQGLIRPFDAYALWQYCDACSDFIEADRIIREEGRVARSDKGAVYQHPAVGMKNKAAGRIKQLGALFGWSPADRVGLIMDGDNVDDDLEKLIG